MLGHMKDRRDRFHELAMDYAELYLGREDLERLVSAADGGMDETEEAGWLDRLRGMLRGDAEGQTS